MEVFLQKIDQCRTEKRGRCWKFSECSYFQKAWFSNKIDMVFEYQRSRNSIGIHPWKLTYHLWKLTCHLPYSRFKIGKLVFVIRLRLKVFKSFLCRTRLEFVHSAQEPSSSLYQLESLQKNQVSQARAFLQPVNQFFVCYCSQCCLG